MTPEQIHELLDNATPGPWEARATYDDGTPRPDTTREMRAGDEYLGIMHAPDADLAAAAPELAKQVLNYHYAVGPATPDTHHAGRHGRSKDLAKGECIVRVRHLATHGKHGGDTEMTPEKARELLDGRTPSPWWWCETDYPEVTVYHEKYGIIAKSVDIEEADLICTAPDLAELVAGLRYEYAVQVTDKDGSVLYAKSYRTLSGDIEEAWWQDEPNEKLAEKWWSKIPACRVRILRRLVGDPEVVR